MSLNMGIPKMVKMKLRTSHHKPTNSALNRIGMRQMSVKSKDAPTASLEATIYDQVIDEISHNDRYVITSL